MSQGADTGSFARVFFRSLKARERYIERFFGFLSSIISLGVLLQYPCFPCKFRYAGHEERKWFSSSTSFSLHISQNRFLGGFFCVCPFLFRVHDWSISAQLSLFVENKVGVYILLVGYLHCQLLLRADCQWDAEWFTRGTTGRAIFVMTDTIILR